MKGNQKWVDSLQWTQRSAYKNATEEAWKIDGKIVGSIKSAGPLSFVKVFQSGHMVPMVRATCPSSTEEAPLFHDFMDP